MASIGRDFYVYQHFLTKGRSVWNLYILICTENTSTIHRLFIVFVWVFIIKMWSLIKKNSLQNVRPSGAFIREYTVCTHVFKENIEDAEGSRFTMKWSLEGKKIDLQTKQKVGQSLLKTNYY